MSQPSIHVRPRAEYRSPPKRHLHLVRSPSDQAVMLVKDHASVLRAVATRLSKNATEAEDLVQDTLERALGSLDQFQRGTSERAWLLTILHHLFIDRCRRLAREGTTVELVADALPNPVAEEEPRWARVSQDQVDDAVGQLAPGFRDTWQRHAEGQSYEEISAALAIPSATVGTRLLRARKKLRTLLFPEVEEA
jgi:RNA polymerase sigma-70 factor (ECF subfamily)